MGSRRRVGLLVAAVVVAAVVLAGCAPSGGGSTPTPTSTPSPAPAPSPTATPTPTPASPTATPSAANLPTDCAGLASAPTRQEAVGDMTLQSDGEGFVRPAPEGAALALGCDWIVGDTTGILLLISTADPAAVSTAVEGLPGQGYTCQTSDDFGAQYCVLPGSGPDTEETVVARDGVWIYYATSNRNGRAFLSEIVSGIFG